MTDFLLNHSSNVYHSLRFFPNLNSGEVANASFFDRLLFDFGDRLLLHSCQPYRFDADCVVWDLVGRLCQV